jgi:hypothetical protein
MIRGSAIVLGVGLIILWIAGLAQHATPWLDWLTVVGALAAFGIAAMPVSQRGMAMPVGAPIGLGIALAVLWVLALSTAATGWLAWWVFAFACAFMIVGLLAIGEQTPTSPTVTHPRTV